jgi:serine/threonine-protein kinase RsbW
VSISLNTLPDDGASPEDAGDEPKVHLVIPATARYLRLARLTAAGLAGDLGFPMNAIEDLRIAVDELCAAIMDGMPPTGELALTYRENDGGLVVEGTSRARSSSAPELHSVARELLNMLADEYSLGAIDGYRNFRLAKYAEGSGV